MIVKSGDDCRQEHLAVQLVAHFYGESLFLAFNVLLHLSSTSAQPLQLSAWYPFDVAFVVWSEICRRLYFSLLSSFTMPSWGCLYLEQSPVPAIKRETLAKYSFSYFSILYVVFFFLHVLV